MRLTWQLPFFPENFTFIDFFLPFPITFTFSSRRSSDVPRCDVRHPTSATLASQCFLKAYLHTLIHPYIFFFAKKRQFSLMCFPSQTFTIFINIPDDLIHIPNSFFDFVMAITAFFINYNFHLTLILITHM